MEFAPAIQPLMIVCFVTTMACAFMLVKRGSDWFLYALATGYAFASAAIFIVPDEKPLSFLPGFVSLATCAVGGTIAGAGIGFIQAKIPRPFPFSLLKKRRSSQTPYRRRK